MKSPIFEHVDYGDIQWDKGELWCYALPPLDIDWMTGIPRAKKLDPIWWYSRCDCYYLKFASCYTRELFLNQLFGDRVHRPIVKVRYKIGYINEEPEVAEIKLI